MYLEPLKLSSKFNKHLLRMPSLDQMSIHKQNANSAQQFPLVVITRHNRNRDQTLISVQKSALPQSSVHGVSMFIETLKLTTTTYTLTQHITENFYIKQYKKLPCKQQYLLTLI